MGLAKLKSSLAGLFRLLTTWQKSMTRLIRRADKDKWEKEMQSTKTTPHYFKYL